ncbi:unnamed protein product [Didymodactylos carnosus]|uniref:Uncharacterized protein n=1 Tax=Didymodactylos carnosus TaxID=1234261 RepID=A0A8S2TCG1_9BILA|nr:unnamed protein product [Didymodactylos carnosus]
MTGLVAPEAKAIEWLTGRLVVATWPLTALCVVIAPASEVASSISASNGAVSPIAILPKAVWYCLVCCWVVCEGRHRLVESLAWPEPQVS